MRIVTIIFKTFGFHLKYAAAAAAAIIILFYGSPLRGYIPDHDLQATPVLSPKYDHDPFSEVLYNHGYLCKKGSSRQHFQQWQDLSPKEQEKMRRKYKEWQSLPSQKRKLYKQLYRQWKHLPPKERRRLQKDLDNWEHLTPQQQNAIRRRFKN